MDAPTGTLLAYSTAPGQIAEDGSGENSVYTKALSLAIRIPGAKVEEVFKRVRIEVMTRTLDEQVPWESSSLTGDFYFSGGATQVPAAAATVTQPALAIDKEAMFWQSIQGSEDADDYQAYLEQFPNGTFASLARVKVRKLQSTKSAIVAPVVEPQPAKSPTGVAASETQIAALPEPTTPTRLSRLSRLSTKPNSNRCQRSRHQSRPSMESGKAAIGTHVALIAIHFSM